jgi:hypothetical protein
MSFLGCEELVVPAVWRREAADEGACEGAAQSVERHFEAAPHRIPVGKVLRGKIPGLPGKGLRSAAAG